MKKQEVFFLWIFVIMVFSYCCKPEKEMAVSTGSVTEITSNSARITGQIIDLGEGIMQHGHCYGITPGVSISDSKTNLGTTTDIGDYSSDLNNLETGVKYYVNAYLSDGEKTVYGKEISFSTPPPTIPNITTTSVSNITQTTAICGGDISDDGGSPVTARGVCWSTSSIPTINNNKTEDGSGTGSFTSNITGLQPCMTYHVRAYATNLEGTAYGNDISFTTAGAIPAITTAAVTGITRTTATSGGNISSDGCTTITARGVCWSTGTNPTTAGAHTTDGSGPGSFTSNLTGLTPNTTYHLRAYITTGQGTAYGNSLQFNTLSIAVATLATNAVTSIMATTAVSGGNITDDGGGNITARGVCWNTNSNPTISNFHTSNGTGTGSFTSSLTGLTSSTTYYVRAYATNSAGTAYGNQVSFRSGFSCGDQWTDPRDGKTYQTVQIGNQCWFAENLNIGTRINGSSDQTDNGVIEKYCYDDIESNCSVYGGLYQWDELMQYTTNESPQGVCPAGWHIPSDNEWKTLEMYLGMSQEVTELTLWRGTMEGSKLKATSGWYMNGNGTNESGFTALPSGFRGTDGQFYYGGNWTDFWSSSQINIDLAWSRALGYSRDNIGRYEDSKKFGFSIRCIKD